MKIYREQKFEGHKAALKLVEGCLDLIGPVLFKLGIIAFIIHVYKEFTINDILQFFVVSAICLFLSVMISMYLGETEASIHFGPDDDKKEDPK